MRVCIVLNCIDVGSFLPGSGCYINAAWLMDGNVNSSFIHYERSTCFSKHFTCMLPDEWV